MAILNLLRIFFSFYWLLKFILKLSKYWLIRRTNNKKHVNYQSVFEYFSQISKFEIQRDFCKPKYTIYFHNCSKNQSLLRKLHANNLQIITQSFS